MDLEIYVCDFLMRDLLEDNVSKVGKDRNGYTDEPNLFRDPFFIILNKYLIIRL